MNIIGNKAFYYHGLGYYNDQDNLETSYYQDIVDAANNNRANETNNYFRRELIINPGFETDYDIASLTRLKSICQQKAILPRSMSGYQLTGWRGTFSENSDDTICLAKSGLIGITIRPNGWRFINRSLSILIDPKIGEDLKQRVRDYKELMKNNPLDTSIAHGEYRVTGEISSLYFIAIAIPFTLIKNQRFQKIEDYYQERTKEIEIIRRILDESNISIPIIDTKTHIDLEDLSKRKRLIRY